MPQSLRQPELSTRRSDLWLRILLIGTLRRTYISRATTSKYWNCFNAHIWARLRLRWYISTRLITPVMTLYIMMTLLCLQMSMTRQAEQQMTLEISISRIQKRVDVSIRIGAIWFIRGLWWLVLCWQRMGWFLFLLMIMRLRIWKRYATRSLVLIILLHVLNGIE